MLPFDSSVDYSSIRHLFEGATGIANLEGAILENADEVNKFKWNDKFSLYSSKEVINYLHDLNIGIVSLCNNHILDYCQPIEKTQQTLDVEGIRHFGLKNHDIIEFTFNGKQTFLITFATFASEHRLNLFNPEKVIKVVRNLRNNKPESYIIVYPHWGVERFKYVEPGDRVLAHKLVDSGANLIVGHHPHIIQPIEIYKSVPIIYSLGNFIFPQTYFGKKKLVFNNTDILDELIVEWDGENIKFNILHFDNETNALTLKASQDIIAYKDVFNPLPNKDPNTPIGYFDYLKFYLSKAGFLDKVVKTRYTATSFGEYKTFVSRKALKLVRNIMIKLHLHNPYKDS